MPTAPAAARVRPATPPGGGAADAAPARPRRLAAALAWARARPVAAAVALGVLVRAALVLASDFPLNDGALFLEMARAIREAQYALPAFVRYNGVDIPFGYPPLAFYLVALLRDALGLDMVQALRVVPLVASCGCLVAFAAFARDVLPRVSAGVARDADARQVLPWAVLAFALLPRTFVWLLMGGGVTRSIGLLFAILALHQAFLLYTRRGWAHAGLMGLFAGLTVLSHLGTAPFVAFSIALLFVAYGLHGRGVLGSALALAVAVAVAAPWGAAVVGHHGWAPFLAAHATGGSAFSDSETRYIVMLRLAEVGMQETGEAMFPVIAVLAFLGALVSARAGQLLLAAWWALILVLEYRAPGTYASVPVALLAGIGVAAVLRPALFPARGAWRAAGDAPAEGGRRTALVARWAPRVMPWAVAAGLFAYVFAGAITRNESVRSEGKLLRGVPPEGRAAMAWVQRATPQGARFAVITGPGHTGIWGDRVSEWFPVLAGRVSVATIQGREWINDGTFKQREAAYSKLQACAGRTTACLAEWASAGNDAAFTHVFVSKERSFRLAVEPLTESLRADPSYAVVYDGPGALVAERRPAGAPGAPVASGAATGSGD